MCDKKTTITIELDNDTYFNMLRYCADTRTSIDAFVEDALVHFIKKHKKKNTKTKLGK